MADPRTGLPDVNAYPVPSPAPGEVDERFTFGLALDVSHVLEAHGYPRPATRADHVRLQSALFTLLHVPDREP